MFYRYRWLRRIIEAWNRLAWSPHNGEPVIIIRPDLAGLRGHVFNPYPDLDGKWVILIADPYDLKRWPGYESGFQHLYRWEFVRAEHGVPSWEDRKWDEIRQRVASDFAHVEDAA